MRGEGLVVHGAESLLRPVSSESAVFPNLHHSVTLPEAKPASRWPEAASRNREACAVLTGQRYFTEDGVAALFLTTDIP